MLAPHLKRLWCNVSPELPSCHRCGRPMTFPFCPTVVTGFDRTLQRFCENSPPPKRGWRRENFTWSEGELKLIAPPAPDIFQDVEVRMTVEDAIKYASASSERAIDLERRLAVCCGRLMACLFCTTTVMGFDRTPQIVSSDRKGRVLPPQRRAETCTAASSGLILGCERDSWRYFNRCKCLIWEDRPEQANKPK